MGAGNSVPLWLNPAGTPSDYDMWGYIPPGMEAPPQHTTSQLYDWGFPDTKGLRTSSYTKNGYSDNLQQIYYVGQQNDVLSTFGSKPVSADNVANVELGTTYNANAFFGSTQSLGGWKPTETTCNPLNYPGCDMSSMRQQAPTVTPYAGWWQVVGTWDNEWNPKPKQAPGETIVVMDRYISKVEQHVANYAAGKYDNLDQVCTKDTSAYDPCTTGFFEKILPFIVGTAGLVVLKVYGTEFLTFLPAQSLGFVYLTTFSTLYSIGAAAEEFSLGKKDGLWTDDVNAAAGSLTLGAGAIVASYQLAGQTYVLPATIGAALASKLLLQRFAFYALAPAVGSAGVLVAVPVMIMHWFEKLFCWLSNAGLSACDDFGENAGGTSGGFPDARRWDVASLAAKLTDIACDENGWARDTPQAKFVYRGLVLNPQWMQAATTTSDVTAGNTLWDKTNRMVNPLGLAAPIHELGGTDVGSTAWNQVWTSKQSVFTGADETSKDPITDTNRFACQNFDILYWGDECDENSDPECSKNNPPAKCATTNPCANATVADGADLALATNMKQWLKALVAASYDPNNIAQQYQIPGAYNAVRPPGDYDMATYLKTCHEDFNIKSGTGFNSITQRGNYANFYICSKVAPPTDAQIPELYANNLFSSHDNLALAWAYVTTHWSPQNVTAYAHYIYHPKGDLQDITFLAWENKFDEARKWKDDLLHINKGFEPLGAELRGTTPWVVSKPLPTDPYIKSHPIGLLPAKPHEPFVPYLLEWEIDNAVALVDGNKDTKDIMFAVTYLQTKTDYPNMKDYGIVSFQHWVGATLLAGMAGVIDYHSGVNYPQTVAYAIKHPVVPRAAPTAEELISVTDYVYELFHDDDGNGSFYGFLTLLPPDQQAIFDTEESIHAWLSA